MKKRGDLDLFNSRGEIYLAWIEMARPKEPKLHDWNDQQGHLLLQAPTSRRLAFQIQIKLCRLPPLLSTEGTQDCIASNNVSTSGHPSGGASRKRVHETENTPGGATFLRRGVSLRLHFVLLSVTYEERRERFGRNHN